MDKIMYKNDEYVPNLVGKTVNIKKGSYTSYQLSSAGFRSWDKINFSQDITQSILCSSLNPQSEVIITTTYSDSYSDFGLSLAEIIKNGGVLANAIYRLFYREQVV